MTQRLLVTMVGFLLAACGGIAQMRDGANQEGDAIVDAGTGGTNKAGGSKNQGGYKTTGGSTSGWDALGGSTNMGGAVSLCGASVCGPGQTCCDCGRGPQCSASSCAFSCGGGDDGVPMLCTRPVDMVTGCMQGQMGEDAGPYVPVDQTVEGTVRSITYDAAPGGCLASLFATRSGWAGRPTTIVVVERNSGKVWDVEYDMPGGFSALNVGDLVSVTYQYKPGGWSATERKLVVSRNLTTMVYVRQGGNITEASDAPVQLSAGQVECPTYEMCGSGQLLQLVASTSRGANAVLSSGGMAFLAPYQVVNGGIYAQVQASCASSFVVGLVLTNSPPVGAE